tara:strand:+ start:2286 stop:2501 length:216 start_codon:yes stop_codon:yes gene_type:complete
MVEAKPHDDPVYTSVIGSDIPIQLNLVPITVEHALRNIFHLHTEGFNFFNAEQPTHWFIPTPINSTTYLKV